MNLSLARRASIFAAGALSLTLATKAYAGPADLDPRWGGTGKVSTDVDGTNTNDDRIVRVLPSHDGGLIALANVRKSDGDYSAVVRYTAAGRLDSTFGTAGHVILPHNQQPGLPACSSQETRAGALQADGKIVLTVVCRPQDHSSQPAYLNVVRLNADGNFDTSFGDAGHVYDRLGGTVGFMGDVVPSDLALSRDGKIVVPFHYFEDDSRLDNYGVARFNADGSRDTTFAFRRTAGTEGARVAVQSDGKVLVTGRDNPFTPYGIFRLNADGSSDTTFGGPIFTGSIALDVINENGVEARISGVSNMVVQPDGKFLVAGNARFSGSTQDDIFVARFNPNGSPDTTFHQNGAVVTDVAGGDDGASRVAIQQNGQIVVGGYATLPADGGAGSLGVAVLRYNADGSLDTAWNGNGIARFDNTTSYETLNDLAIGPTGRVFVASTPPAANAHDLFTFALRGTRVCQEGSRIMSNEEEFSIADNQAADSGCQLANTGAGHKGLAGYLMLALGAVIARRRLRRQSARA
ncbi:hypothetical protein LZC95_05615 [Pendulispora brunnea]|uniref:Delta-60 repeat domain-containing protein n=1 Tax=Pendulispora brunnea TaxID=2905690 RepID=A0ABZ2KCJ2_9BACT